MTTTATATRMFLGSCPKCGHGIAHEGATRAACSNCGTQVTLKRVQGVYSDAVPCDDRCQYAVGPICNCPCAGANHGIGYIHPVGERPVWVTKRDADRHAKKAERKTAKAAAEQQSKTDRIAAIVAAHPALAPLAAEGYRSDNYFLMDIHWSLVNKGTLSPKQIEKAVESIDRDAARAARDAARNAARAAAVEAGVRVPTGKAVVVEGRLTGVELESTGFAYSAKQWRGTLHTDAGWSVKITVPAALIDAAQDKQRAATDAGDEWKPWTAYLDRVKMTVDLDGPYVPKGETEPVTPLFGYGKRPRNAEIVG